MDYTISKGDCLWNIAKNNYNCKSNAEILETVHLIAKENNMELSDYIYAGNNLVLPETDSFISSKKQEDEDVVAHEEADALDAWSSEENLDKYFNGEIVEDFEMFDALGEGMSTEEYVENLTEFSQAYIDKYDQDGDGKWSQAEFDLMTREGEEDIEKYAKEQLAQGMDGIEIPEEIVSQYVGSLTDMNKLFFESYQMNDDNTTISADEFASQLFMADMNEEGYVDGKIDFVQYNTFASMFDDPNKFWEDVAARKEMHEYVIKPYLKK